MQQETRITRTSRSDEGILELTTAVFKDIFDLSEETTSRMIRIIRNQGQWFDLKNSVRTLSGVAHRRLNDVINMARSAPTDVLADQPEDENGEQEFSDHNEFDRDSGNERMDQNERPAYENMTFVSYLINELQYSDQDLRDPAKKQEITRMMRAGDSQAQQLVNRGEKQQKQDQRQEIQQEKDPQKAGLRRRRLALQRQLAQIDQQLEEPGTEQQTGFDSY